MEDEYRGISLTMDGVHISPTKSSPTPSELDNLDSESENMLRIIGCQSIQDACLLLKLPQVTAACAQMLYHRFYFSKSFVTHHWEHYSMACVFLSSKIEESCRRLRDVVNVFVHLRQLRDQSVFIPLPVQEYAELKPYVIKAERKVLKELGFCVHGKHPHKLICIYLHLLGQANNTDLTQRSWNYMNDSLRTIVFACYHSETIAIACIYLAALDLQIPLGTNWLDIFNECEETIKTICLSILTLYSLNKPDVLELERKVYDLREAQREARNKKIVVANELQVNKTHTENLKEESKKLDHERKDKMKLDTKEKENMEKISHHNKSYKSRKNQLRSPKRNHRHRSRSDRKDRDHSREKRRSVKKSYKKEHRHKEYRRSNDIDDEYSSNKRYREETKNYYTNKRSRSRTISDSERRYKKRRRSSS